MLAESASSNPRYEKKKAGIFREIYERLNRLIQVVPPSFCCFAASVYIIYYGFSFPFFSFLFPQDKDAKKIRVGKNETRSFRSFDTIRGVEQDY